MPRRSPWLLGRMVQRMGRFSPPRHRELVRGMVAELDSIADPIERRRFAVGAIAAIARLALTGVGRVGVPAHDRLVVVGEPEHNTISGGASMSNLTTRQLLGRHLTPFVVSLASLTALLLARHAVRLASQLSATGSSAGEIAQAVLLAVPFTAALTIPMSVFVAVLWVFTRLGREGVLQSAGLERHGVRRLVTPVMGAAAVIAALTFVSNAYVVPRANARLAEVTKGAPSGLTDRTMTIGQLREAALTEREATSDGAATRAAGYGVEIQKKFAIAAAAVALALAAAAIAIRFPQGGGRLVFGASGVVFTGYWLLLTAGEALADELVVSPWVAMWMANGLLLALALLLVWRQGRSVSAPGPESLAIGG
ncbi:MAG: LptF/LptG family permease [Longimicrobiales bacterium]